MLKSFIALTCPIFVLISGLVSCNQETKTADVYSVPAPSIRNSNGKISKADWEKDSARHLDLYDSFDFSEAHPDSVKVRTECRQGDKTYNRELRFSATDSIDVAQLLPDDLLSSDLHQVVTKCSFRLDLFNATGSDHVFEFPFCDLMDAEAGDVQVARGTEIEFSNRSTAEIRLFCQDFTSRPIPFHTKLDLAPIDFLNGADVKNEKDFADRRPFQTCRARIKQDDKVNLSNLFTLQVPATPVLVNVTKVDENPNTSAHTIGHLFPNGRPLILYSLEFSNPSTTVRHLRVPRGPLRLRARAYVEIFGPEFRMTYDGTYVAVALALNPETPMQMTDLDYEMTLPPGSHFAVNFEIASRKFRFNGPTADLSFVPKLKAVTFQLLDPFIVTEVASDERVLTQYSPQVSDIVRISPDRSPLPDGPDHPPVPWW